MLARKLLHTKVLHHCFVFSMIWTYPDSKVHGANMGPIWGQQDPGGSHAGPINFAIWLAAPNILCSSSKYIFGNVSMYCGYTFYHMIPTWLFLADEWKWYASEQWINEQ